MEIYFQRCLVIPLLVLFACSLFAGQDSKLNIAVLDLDPTGVAKSDAQFLSDRLRTELFETGRFQIVERDKMNEILTEQGFQQSGCTSLACAVEIGQLLNVQVMVAGNIGKIEDLYSLSIRMIDVGSGVIIRTATKDYEGRLSEVLTEVIPALARDLASGELEKKDDQQKPDNMMVKAGNGEYTRFAVLLEGGFSSLTYTTEINKEIEKLNAIISPDIEELSGFYSIGLELKYALSQTWQVKLGLIGENPLSAWQTSLTDYTSPTNAAFAYRLIEIERINKFVNLFLGVEYALWYQKGIYDISLGFDIGSTSLSSDFSFNYQMNDGTQREHAKTYNYSSFTVKISLGATYYLSRLLSAGLRFQFKSVQPFDISNQAIDLEIPEEIKAVFFPEEINAAGLLVSFYLGFHF